jgi:hypothetical protein
LTLIAAVPATRFQITLALLRRSRRAPNDCGAVVLLPNLDGRDGAALPDILAGPFLSFRAIVVIEDATPANAPQIDKNLHSTRIAMRCRPLREFVVAAGVAGAVRLQYQMRSWSCVPE